jgi:predicted aconitase with swiveling domain
MIGRALTAGNANGTVLKLDVPLSFWGGVDLHSGAIIDQSHPRRGAAIAGRVLVMPHARGSSSSSSALMELARAGIAPVAIVMQRHDPILVIGSLVAAELYGIELPIVLLGEADWDTLREDEIITIAVSGDEAVLGSA